MYQLFVWSTIVTSCGARAASLAHSLNLLGRGGQIRELRIRHAHYSIRDLIGFLFVWIAGLTDFEFGLNEITESSIAELLLKLKQGTIRRCR